jgi:hypothetical protein
MKDAACTSETSATLPKSTQYKNWRMKLTLIIKAPDHKAYERMGV